MSFKENAHPLDKKISYNSGFSASAGKKGKDMGVLPDAVTSAGEQNYGEFTKVDYAQKHPLEQKRGSPRR